MPCKEKRFRFSLIDDEVQLAAARFHDGIKPAVGVQGLMSTLFPDRISRLIRAVVARAGRFAHLDAVVPTNISKALRIPQVELGEWFVG